MLGNLKKYFSLMFLSAQIVAGRKFWIVILIPLLWLALQAAFILLGWREGKIEPVNAQALMGFPLAVIAIGFGIRIIAGEIDGRTLEIAYTVPGGCHRIWLAKLAASVCLLLISEALLAIVVLVFFIPSVPFVSLYGALQASVFYLILGMAFSAFFRSEITGAMATVAVFTLNAMIGFEDFQLRISPFFNPLVIQGMDSDQLFAQTLQNRIFFIILIVGITLLTFSRVERREKMLGD